MRVPWRQYQLAVMAVLLGHFIVADPGPETILLVWGLAVAPLVHWMETKWPSTKR